MSIKVGSSFSRKLVSSAAFAAVAGLSSPLVFAQASSSEIDDLKRQVQEMQRKLDAIQSQQAQQAQQAKAAEPAAQPTTTSAGSSAPPGALRSDAAEAKTTIGAQVFLDVSHIKEEQNGKEIPPTGTGFDVKRAYLIINHKFNDVWSANLTTDAQYISSTAGTGFSNSATSNSGGVTEIFIKRLYLQAKLNDAFVVHAGSYTSPWIGYLEQELYGYRFIEKTQTDRLGYASTSDWGLNATGVAGNDGLIGYSASVVNGGGFKNPTRTKDVDFEGRIGIKPVDWLMFGIGYYNGHLGQITSTTSDFAKNTASRFDVAAGVHVAGFRAGAEYFNAKNYKAASATTGILSGPGGVVVATNVTPALPIGSVKSDKADGVSGWVSYNFDEQWSVFGRYDRAKLSKTINPDLKDTYFHLGVDFKPIKQVDVALVYKDEKVDNGSISIGSGDGNSSYTIGGTGVAKTGPTTDGTFKEIGIYTQYVF
jgi:hypothetical protein